MKAISQILKVSVALLGLHSVSNAATITTIPSFDTGIRSGSVTGSGGTAIQIGNLATSTTGIYGMMQFNLSSLIPKGSTIDSVSLKLTTVQADGSTALMTLDVQLYQILRPFTADVSWTNYATGQAWGTAGGTGFQDRGALLSTAQISSKAASKTVLTLTNSTAFSTAVSTAIEGNGILYLQLALADVGSDLNRRILEVFSMDAAGINTQYRPSLTVQYTLVPEPSTGVLMIGAGIVGGLFLRKRRSSSL